MKEPIFKQRGEDSLLAPEAMAQLHLQLPLRNSGSSYDRNSCTIYRCSDETVTATKLIFQLGVRLTQMR